MEAFVSAGAMGREKGLWCCWCLVLWPTMLLMVGVVSYELYDKTCTSHCGIIPISYPFRLPNDPPYCGHADYELACDENDVTLLNISGYPGSLKVTAINYHNFRIKVVDPGILLRDCSSLPFYSFSQYEFNYVRNPYGYYERTYSTLNNHCTKSMVFKQVAYLSCSEPVRDDTSYVDTAPCVKGGGHLYAVVGDLLASRFQPQCRLKSVTLVASNWESLVADGIKSYADIHKLLSLGFELSWFRRACADRNCSDGTTCVFSPENRSLLCLRGERDCTSPLGRNYESCGKLPRFLIFAEDFLEGIWKGLYGMANISRRGGTYYDSGPSKLLIKLGVFTGRFLLPFVTVRFLFGVVLLSMIFIYTCRKRHLSIYEDVEDFIRLHDLIPIRYSYKDLKTMTQNFKIKLGEGGFATVYKGKLRSGPDVAIKMLGKSNKANGQDFMSEVATIGRIHHFNVVHLVGFCVEGTKRALIYEFMSHGSLDKYIFSKEENKSLSYRKIYEISLGVARGIAYLHHGCEMQILHFDIKPHNILLDENFTPKVSDFGLARLYAIDDDIATLTARGTMGYIAPELFYKNIGKVSHKVDVYSFGMLLMEMTSQRRNLNPQAEHSSQLYYPLWIYDQFDDNKDIEIENLMEEEKDLVKKMFIVALWCIQLKPVDRPSMNKVIEMLEANDVSSLQMPPKPSLYPNERVLVDDVSNSDEISSVVSIHSHGNIGEGTK
ncbi:hypothetical protein QN277_018680 [Acacia crassicarpa]|uniref:Protein kinase domain-containing protein n=1 Tax=Acacia crassicarpa TaxID=499986 RepID=A0AAE1MRT5_9FABA|nr:hypothetical protein QN277_018680 [Acacia crassicarpa]